MNFIQPFIFSINEAETEERQEIQGRLNAIYESLKKKKNGLEEKYHTNGQLWFRCNYINGKEDGLVEEYHDNGEIQKSWNYVNGEKHGLCFFNCNGVKSETYYIKGKQVPPQKYYQSVAKYYYKWIEIASKPPCGRLFLYDMNKAMNCGLIV